MEKHSDQKSQVMATLEMARCGPVTGAWKAAAFIMVDSSRQQTGFNRFGAVARCKQTSRSASGVTFVVMDR